MTNTIQLPNLSIARYRFTLEALDPIHLPPFKGSALRGGFGHTLKRLVCYHSGADCKGCRMGNDCVYGYLFETSPPEDSEVLSTHQAIPRPFVLQPPLDRRATFEPGQCFDFYLVLVGQAIAYLPYFVLVFRELGQIGLGRSRGKYALQAVRACHPISGQEQAAYDDETLLSTSLEVTAGEIAAHAEQLPADQVDVEFLTPTRLKFKGKLLRQGPPFHVLLRTLLGRVSSLSYFHCGQRWETDFRAWIDRARDVQLAGPGTAWVDWGRYSGRQQQRVRMGGLVGRAAYEGDLRPYLPLLALGELVHVGKGTVFGNGQYVVNG